MLKNKKLLPVIVAFLLFVIPFTVYLALTKQIIFKRAAFGEVTVNLVPTEVVKSVGEEFAVEVYLNSGSLPVSAASLKALNLPSNILYVRAAPEVGEGKPFTDVIAGTGQNSLPVALVARKPTAELPKGNFKMATFFFQALAPGAGNINLSNASFEIVGYNQNNEDVNFTVKQGTQVAYNITGELCKVSACPDITLAHELQTSGKYNINVSWTAPSAATQYIYRIYRNIGAPVPDENPAVNQVHQTVNTVFTDTNSGNGFNGEITVYYNVDAYQTCR